MMDSRNTSMNLKIQAPNLQFEDKLTAITHFSTGLDKQISTMILSMTTPPNTLNEWIEKAKLF